MNAELHSPNNDLWRTEFQNPLSTQTSPSQSLASSTPLSSNTPNFYWANNKHVNEKKDSGTSNTKKKLINSNHDHSHIQSPFQLKSWNYVNTLNLTQELHTYKRWKCEGSSRYISHTYVYIDMIYASYHKHIKIQTLRSSFLSSKKLEVLVTIH